MAPMQRPSVSSDLKGAMPTVYNPAWQSYTDLTAAQIAAFQSFPQDLIKYAGTKRWQKEIGGITVGGIAVATSDSSLIRLLGLNEWAKSNPTGSTSFTVGGTAVTVTAAQAAAMFSAVSNFVQACRGAEAELIVGISATPPTITMRAQIDAALAAIPTQ